MTVTRQPQSTLTPQEYLAIERQNDYKSEYFDGHMFAMAGANRRHNLIVGNVTRLLGNQLQARPCEVYPNDMRVRIPHTGLYTYPDVVIVCGTADFEDDEEDTLLNPTVILEVLSKSTAKYDRSGKFLHYRKIESLLEYLLISQTIPLVEHYIRQADSPFWLFSEVNTRQDVVELPSIQCQLVLSDLYDKVVFTNQDEQG